MSLVFDVSSFGLVSKRACLQIQRILQLIFNFCKMVRISDRQKHILAHFMASNLEFAHNRLVGGSGSGGNSLSQRLWRELTEQLNAVGDGTTKTVEGWKNFWKVWKYRIKQKASENRRAAGGTGGGPSTWKPLTDVELVVLGVIGERAVTGYQEHLVPLNAPGIDEVTLSPADEETVKAFRNDEKLPPGLRNTSPQPGTSAQFDTFVEASGQVAEMTEGDRAEPQRAAAPQAAPSTEQEQPSPPRLRTERSAAGASRRRRGQRSPHQSPLNDWLRETETRRINNQIRITQQLEQINANVAEISNTFKLVLEAILKITNSK